MKLKEAVELVKLNPWLDIFDTLWIKQLEDYENDVYYKNFIEKLPKWNYFISDLDGTFFRWVLIQETFKLFSKYVRNQDVRYLDIEKYKYFLDDYSYFVYLEKLTYNKQIPYSDYMSAGMFILYKYHDIIDWDIFLSYLKDQFYLKEKVNPFRFSLEKMKQILLDGNIFLFVSWASNFVFEIYLRLLKDFIKNSIGEKYIKNIYGISSFSDISSKVSYGLYWKDHKDNFIKILKKRWIVNKVIWWMGDTIADFWISYNLEDWGDFFFVNPEYSVLEKFDKFSINSVNYHFIMERKNLIFEFDRKNITMLDI